MIGKFKLRRLIEDALREDIGSGDVTTMAIVKEDCVGTARAIAKSDTVVAGIDVFVEVFLVIGRDMVCNHALSDGVTAKEGQVIADMSGNLCNILAAERVALNIFQRMCGIATLTRRYVNAVEGTKARILDTRKTTPCLRDLEKYSVTVGGGFNHRAGLFGGVLIKENHIKAADGISKAVELVRHNVPMTLKIEVEVKNLEEVREALSTGCDIIMLDNMKTDEMREALSIIQGRAIVEASGNVTLSNVREIAETGVDFISVGALTHSVSAADISLIVS
ncbi:MAG: carboxylating nicotinate-nucleotide diphosphorylase [Deltaproteobacteria bacterium]|nr:carboxylating nicotinate-nucleotide diphosphorylase [Deltaproteobacteria bacterium]